MKTVRQEEQNKELVRRAVRAWNKRDREAFDACYVDELVVRTGEGPDDYFTVDHDQHWEAVQSWYESLDASATEREMVAAGDRVFVRWTYEYRHIGEVRGAEPTGKEFGIDAWQIFKVEDGLIAEERTLLDRLSLYEELGVVELPEPSDA